MAPRFYRPLNHLKIEQWTEKILLRKTDGDEDGPDSDPMRSIAPYSLGMRLGVLRASPDSLAQHMPPAALLRALAECVL